MIVINRVIIFCAKVIAIFVKFFHLGAAGTWPGEIALNLSPQILNFFNPQFKKGITIVAGTNGKTTTSLMVKKILGDQGYNVVHNASGANLLNGIISSCIQSSNWYGKLNADWAVFEVDENTLPQIISSLKFKDKNSKLVVILLNLFRDQLDRYGEVDVIAEKWEKALFKLPGDTELILNADDPLIAHLGKKFNGNVSYFGIENKKYFLKNQEHATDSIYCLNCGNRLYYHGIFFSHLGIWRCYNCGEKRPKPNLSYWNAPLPGVYNLYNTIAAVLTLNKIGIKNSAIEKSLIGFKPAFGRGEEFIYNNQKIIVFLSKNPAGFNESLRTVLEFKPKILVIILNDRIPDGRDISWIWDVDFEMIPDDVNLIVSGDRVYDLALRLKYSRNFKFQIPNSKFQINSRFIVASKFAEALRIALDQTKNSEIIYILPTYSAMLEARKILIGRKIL